MPEINKWNDCYITDRMKKELLTLYKIGFLNLIYVLLIKGLLQKHVSVLKLGTKSWGRSIQYFYRRSWTF